MATKTFLLLKPDKQYTEDTFISTQVSKPFVTGIAGIYSNSYQFFFGDWTKEEMIRGIALTKNQAARKHIKQRSKTQETTLQYGNMNIFLPNDR